MGGEGAAFGLLGGLIGYLIYNWKRIPLPKNEKILIVVNSSIVIGLCFLLQTGWI